MGKQLVIRRVCRLWWGLLWVGWFVTAAQAQYRFDHWTADNGLPQNSVRDIVQTRAGYLWLATFDGLVRFDGVRFTVFNKSNSPGIVSNRFNWLFEDAQGALWASTEDSGITRMQAGRFTTFTTQHGLDDNTIRVMGGDEQGNLILVFAHRTVRWANGQFQTVETDTQPLALDRPARQPPYVKQITRKRADEDATRLPCYSHAGVVPKVTCFVAGQRRTWLLPDNGLGSLNVQSPLLDRARNIWFYSLDKGLVRVEHETALKLFAKPDGLLGNKTVLVYGAFPLRAFSRGDGNSLWLTDIEAQRSQLVVPQMPEGMQSLVDVLVAYADHEGNFWFGTAHNGLYRARRQTVTVYANAQGLSGTEVYPILEDRTGSKWLGSAIKGLFQFNHESFKNIALGPDQYSNTVTALHQDRAGHLWIGAIDRALRWDAGKLETLSPAIAPEELGTYWTIHEDAEGALWLGAIRGVMRYQNGVAQRFTTREGLAGDDTKVVIDDAAGGVWLGSYGGLTHYRAGQFKAWHERDGLPSNNVRALYQDNDGALWIGTYDGGLGRYRDGRFTRFTQRDGLFDNGVFQILEDDYGWLWLSCNRGIYRVRKQELNDFAAGKLKTITSIAYGKSDGLLNVECNGGRWPAGIKARDGKLWFPTMEGVAVIDPATVTANPQPPQLMIEGMKIDYQSIPVDEWDALIHNPNAVVRIQPGQENFEIEYTALSFINSEHLQFKYKLEGLDQDWVNLGTRRTAYFSHVPPGTYTFKVIAANSDGIWNENGRSLRLVVLPPFYRTWWFLTLSALAVAGALAGIFQYRVAQLEKRQAAQQAFARQLIESQESERKRIASELHDSLGQNLLIIKNRALLNSLTSGDEPARTQFTEFSTAVSQTIEEVRTISHDLRPAHLDQLGLRIALVALIEKVDASSPLSFTHDIPDLEGLFAPGDDINLYRIVQECLNNILKHSGATQATVNITVRAEVFTLTIQDNGRGFTPNGAEGTLPPKVGLGLQSIAERVRILGGTHTIQSVPSQGTTTTVRIELADEQT